MADSFTDSSTEGIFTRLKNALAGLLIGPLLVIAAIILLSWNEGCAVTAIKGLADAATKVVEVHGGDPAATNPASTNQDKLVHVIGTANAHGPVADPALGLGFADQVTVVREAAMYQWKESRHSKSHTSAGGSKTTTTTYTYAEGWFGTAQDSSGFKHPDGHTNPAMPFGSARFVANDAHLGGYALDAGTLGLIDPPQPLAPAAPAGWSANGGNYYNGDPATPKIGDMRVSYRGLPSGATLSVLADQSGNGFAPFTTANGYQVQLAELGNRPASVMLADKRSEESMLTWILRGVGAIAIFVGLRMFLSPLSTLASVVPFLGGLVGGALGLIALVITIPLTLIVIALAWIAFRPLLGGALLLAAAAAFYGLWRLHRSRRPQPTVPPPAPA
ncbi:MAG TPA: TMEM43 family protein [Rhodanobacter sp.]|nr:TMEM43 family protein [Rhodanobacter sp.]